MARGFIGFTEDGKSIGAVGQALYIRFVLTNATRWTAFQATDGGEGGDTGFFIESPRGQLLVQPRTFDTWWFVLLHPDAPAGDVIAATAPEWGDSAPEMAVFVRSRTLTLTLDDLTLAEAVALVGGFDPGSGNGIQPGMFSHGNIFLAESAALLIALADDGYIGVSVHDRLVTSGLVTRTGRLVRRESLTPEGLRVRAELCAEIDGFIAPGATIDAAAISKRTALIVAVLLAGLVTRPLYSGQHRQAAIESELRLSALRERVATGGEQGYHRAQLLAALSLANAGFIT